MEPMMRKDETIGNKDIAVNGHGRKLVDAMPVSSEEVMSYATEFADKFRSVSGDAVKESLSFAKKYPIHTALGACAIGFLAGILAKRS
jgi:hypothetical protein